MSSFKHGSTIEIVDAATGFASIYHQTALLGLAKSNRLFKTSLTMWAFQSVRVKMLGQPGGTCLSIHEFYDWKVHAPILQNHLF